MWSPEIATSTKLESLKMDPLLKQPGYTIRSPSQLSASSPDTLAQPQITPTHFMAKVR